MVKIHRLYLFIWTHSEQEIEKCLKDLNNFTPDLRITHEASKNGIQFLYLKGTIMHIEKALINYR